MAATEFDPILNPDPAIAATFLLRLLENANGGVPFLVITASSTAWGSTHRGRELIFDNGTQTLTVAAGLTVGLISALSPIEDLQVVIDAAYTVNGDAGGGTFTVSGATGAASIRVYDTNKILLKGAVA